MSRAVALGLVFAAAFTATAGAAEPLPQQSSPADGAVARRDAPLTFTVQDPSDLFSPTVTVSSSPTVDGTGALSGPVLDLFDLYGGPPAYGNTRIYASETGFLSVLGTYYWQASRIDCDYPGCLALSAVRSFTIVAAGEHSDPVPVGAGHQVDSEHLNSFRLNTASIPDGVDPARFKAIAVRSAARWGIGFAGTTSAAPHVRDGISSVGFSPDIGLGYLGLTWTYQENFYRPGKRRCHRRHHRRVCHRGPKQLAGTRVSEEDIEIDPYREWQAGPRYPNTAQFDLESLLLHELGHFAGNDHAPECADSPMTPSQAPEDWWHASADRYAGGCGAFPSMRRSHSRAAATDFRVVSG